MQNNIIWNIKTFAEFSTSDLYKIIRARMEVFVEEQNITEQDLDNYDQKAVHIWAEQDGEILAYCRVFDQGIKYPEASIGRVLTTQKARGKGLGKQLITYAVETIENRFRASTTKISAQEYLTKFYNDFGFESTGKNYIEAGVAHLEMIRKTKDCS